MSPGIEHLLREGPGTLQAILLIQSLCWFFLGVPGPAGRRRKRGALAYLFVGSGLMGLAFYTEDVRALELLLFCGSVVLPAVALTRERFRPGEMGRGWWLLVLVPSLTAGWMLVRGLVIPSVECAQHEAAHGPVHRQWRLEYRALLALERMRERHTGQSRLGPRDHDRLPEPGEIVVQEAPAPPGGWAYVASAPGCDNCRSFYLGSDDAVRFARRRAATALDRQLHWDELDRLRAVIDGGCYVLGDVLCR